MTLVHITISSYAYLTKMELMRFQPWISLTSTLSWHLDITRGNLHNWVTLYHPILWNHCANWDLKWSPPNLLHFPRSLTLPSSMAILFLLNSLWTLVALSSLLSFSLIVELLPDGNHCGALSAPTLTVHFLFPAQWREWAGLHLHCLLGVIR